MNLPNINKLNEVRKHVFAAALDRNEGIIKPGQLFRTADRALWASARLLNDRFIPARNLKFESVDTLFTEQGNKRGHRFLFEERKDWTRSRLEIILTRKFHLPTKFHSQLDVLLNHVFDIVEEDFGSSLALHSDLEFACEGWRLAGKQYTFYGVPDYSVWYGPVEKFATNFIIVQTETPGYFDEATVHAYMGMIHMARKHRGGKNRTVYGLATDSNEFWFYQIDNDTRWSHTLMTPENGYFYEDIAGLIASILHQAYLLAQQSGPAANPNELPASRLEIRQLPHQDTHEIGYERLKELSPEGLDTWIT
ncbi:hypothetical protein N7466_009033 [Penicillium verhagenii]|uniref:uncharacterized protein n=1 Tax=Penicillium verhagenii TaxID=1562060 RepID=UPI00254593DB|nr:uncharacterized protein N7466_009033 [Penicillium verhagenii]KAJ5924846.1 hypothetical protein N7466_009033 [Penicillium verhagenii]